MIDSFITDKRAHGGVISVVTRLRNLSRANPDGDYLKIGESAHLRRRIYEMGPMLRLGDLEKVSLSDIKLLEGVGDSKAKQVQRCLRSYGVVIPDYHQANP